MIIRKGPDEIERIARAGELSAATILHVGEHLRAGLSADARVVEVRGRGLLIGLTLTAPEAAGVVATAQARGFLLNAPTADRVRLAPPLVLTREDADGFLAAWPAILHDALGGSA